MSPHYLCLLLVLCLSVQSLWAVCAPSQFQAKPAGPTVTALIWANISSEVTSYELQRYDNGWTAIVTASAHITHYCYRGLARMVSYDYRIRSVSGGNVSAWVQAPSTSNLEYQPGRGPIHHGFNVSIAAGHDGGPTASYFAVLNQHAGANGAYTFELPNLDSATYGKDASVSGEYLNDRLHRRRPRQL